MMLTHDELIAGERIQGAAADLRACEMREIARIRHAVELPLQQSLAGRFDRKVKDCVKYEGKWRRQQSVVEPNDVGVAYSLMPRMAATRMARGRRYSIASVPNSSREVASTGSAGSAQRHAPPFAIDQHSRETQAALSSWMLPSDRSRGLRLIARQ